MTLILLFPWKWWDYRHVLVIMANLCGARDWTQIHLHAGEHCTKVRPSSALFVCSFSFCLSNSGFPGTHCIDHMALLVTFILLCEARQLYKRKHLIGVLLTVSKRVSLLSRRVYGSRQEGSETVLRTLSPYCQSTDTDRYWAWYVTPPPTRPHLLQQP